MRVRAATFLALTILVVGCSSPATDTRPAEYIGSLEPQLVSASRGPGGVLEDAGEEAVALLGDMVPAGAAVQVAELKWRRGTELAVYLVTSAEGERFVVADGNRDGAFDESERSVLEPARGTVYEATLTISLENGPVDTYDLVVSWADYSEMDIEPENMPEPRLMANRPVLHGSVDVNGQEVLVKVPYSFETDNIAPGYQYIDADGDGAFDDSKVSREETYVPDGATPPVHRINDTYVSIQGIDLSNWTITLADHPAEDYKRVELALGGELPDIEFVDFEGNTRRLSEFRGKYVLVDVWGSWCGPCRADVPHHKKVYAEYKDRGFEIVGLDDEQSRDGDFDEGLEKAKTYVAEEEMTWPQATEESIKEFLELGLQVRAWPTAILLDPEGKIISLDQRCRPSAVDTDCVDQPGLRFERLETTLEELLGEHQ